MTITTIRNNGSKWAGQAPDTIETLLETMEEYALDPAFEDYGNFAYEYIPAKGWTEETEQYKGCMMFSGNFAQYSHTFGIITNDQDIINKLTTAIRNNQTRDDYKLFKIDYVADKIIKEVAQKKFHNKDLSLQELYSFPHSDEGEKMLDHIKSDLVKELNA